MTVGDLADHDYWLPKTRWFSPRLDVAAVATILELQETTVRQYAARDVAGFPAPLTREGGRNYWSADQIFTYIDTERPQLRHRIPRLYAPANLNPAVFLFAERLAVQRPFGVNVEFAVHHWQPSDGRGPIAVAYPAPLDEPAWDYASMLLEQLPAVSAVAVVTNEISLLPGEHGWQAALGVAERGHPAWAALRFKNVRKHVVEMGWYHLAHLLGHDLPWWSASLRDLNAITSWFPGAPRQQIRPRGLFYNESMLRQLVTHAPHSDAARLGDLVDRINRILEGPAIGDELPVGEETERPGLVQAAEPLYRLPEIPAAPDEHELGWLLHQHVPDPLAADTAATTVRMLRPLEPLVAYVAHIGPQRGTLATEWLSDSVAVSAPASDELGFAIARQAVSETERVTRYCKHRRNPLTWLVETDAGAVYATVGTKVPATGHLIEFELAEHSAFFRDSNGSVWPLPAPARGHYYTSGYAGTGPNNLYKSVRALASDASRNLAALGGHVTVDERSPLWRYILRNEPPFALNKAELATAVSGCR
ncbi:hypothetical protein [Mycobacterium talmoniae]|nr:hypothetical protein [Mycobacterium talmoniae]